MQLTPMMQQYMDIKGNYQDCILFFRLGDFYEMFFEDAITASKELEITLTGKSCGQEERAPMCGVPFHSADSYIAKLVDKGYKVAICEQTEEPATAKGIVKREVIQIITPGTVVNQTMLNEKENNFLASVFAEGNGIGLAYCDISTGELAATYINDGNMSESLSNELTRINAKEILINEKAEEFISVDALKKLTNAYFSVANEQYYNENTANNMINSQFGTNSLKGLGIDESKEIICALGALLGYLFETRKQNLSHISKINVYDMNRYMSLDKATLRNLEITETLYEKRVQGSLLGVLDKTHTAMGSRMMKKWLREPLNIAEAINQRLDAVEVLVDEVLARNNIKEALKRIYDLERLGGRVACGNANGKDLIALRNSLNVIPDLKSELSITGNFLLKKLDEQMNPKLLEISELIEKSIVEEPPFTTKEGNLIKEGFSEELDSLRFSIKDGQIWIAEFENKERERTGIKKLKVRFNKVFGYYIEISKSNLDFVPDNYIRKQTLVNCERFITPELKEMESLVLNAEAKINQMEYEIFTYIRMKIQAYTETLQETSSAIAAVDVLTAFAQVSATLGYVKPHINEGNEITLVKGRHPVIEQMIRDGIFVSNDVYMNDKDSSMLLITGPNMAGKSTYMRQTALIVLMAQAGCFVPCESAKIGIVDRIYTRIGASDNLAMGQSTFFVEMSELAYILNTATSKSLVILDEIGRGTSTYDGLSIAWAVVEHLCNADIHIRTLFATHYHELTVLEESVSGIVNLNVDVTEKNGNIVFLHKIVKGSASQSYGIHVAKLAGVPNKVLEGASAKLLELEKINGENSALLNTKEMPENKQINKKFQEETQLSLFNFVTNPVIESLKSIDLMKIAPWEAIKILEELQEAAND